MALQTSLADTLAAHVRRLEEERPQTAATYANIVSRLVTAGAGSSAPGVGDQLPPFQLPDDRGRLVSSGDLLAEGPLVVSMNRGHWCAFCRHELGALQDINDIVGSHGGNIIAITPERQAFAKKLKDQCKLEFPVLCDVDNGYALSLGLAVWCGDEIKPIFSEIGIDLALYQGNPSWLVPIPATYIVATDGRIVGSFVEADFRQRMAPEDILTALRTADLKG